ncbi:ATP-binding protein [Paenibacillus sp. PL2-23]|uniref:ATP-binding protein n=1 Tax=Paenibacillus sp. PL2-23 TaxID=2100729 RepID=UPI0030FCDDE4
MQIVKDFLLNVLIVSLPLILYPFMYRFFRGKRIAFQTMLCALFGVSILLTMCFPVVMNGLNYDMRSIPLTIGALYGGGWVALALYGTVTLGREMLGSSDLGWYILAFIPSFFFVLVAIRWFERARLRQKLGIAVVVCTLVKGITIVLFLQFTGRQDRFWSHLEDTLILYAIQGLMAAAFVYAIELVHRHYQMQEEVVRSEKMRLVSEMAASVAHEIRNPLTSVKGFIHLMGGAEVSPEKRAFYKDICFTELERAENIISDYLSLARTEPETVETIDLNEEASYLSNILLNYTNLNNIKLYIALQDSVPLQTRGDRSKLRQALINIGKNAVEAMPDGGSLELRTEVRLDKATLSISDTGVGMTPEGIARLGTPFYSTKEKGTGLGTMISFSIIKKMDGKIEVDSEPGKGSKFTIILPKSEYASKKH